MTSWIIVAVLLLSLIGGGIYFYRQVKPQLSKVDSLSQSLTDLQIANTALVAEKDGSAKKISELEKAKKSLTDANVALTNQVVKLVGDYKKVKQSEVYFAKIYRNELSSNEKISKDNEALRKEIARLKAENEALKKENGELKAQYEQLLTEKSGSDATKQAVEQKISSLNQQIADTLASKNALQSQLDTAKKAVDVAEKRLADSEKAAVKSPTEDKVKENLCLKSEIKFLYATILVATSSEENLSGESRTKATNLMVRMTYQPVSNIRFEAAKGVMKDMPQDGAESIHLMRKAWESWSKASE